jgi:RNA recognition motif-containing protein
MENGRSKCYGFVCFRSAEEASEAIYKMNQRKLYSLPIFVSLWQPQRERLQSSDNQPTLKSRSKSTPRGISNRVELPPTPSNQPQRRFRFSTRLPN